MLFSVLVDLLDGARYSKWMANLFPSVLSLLLRNTILSGVVDLFKYQYHQLVINEATNSSRAPTENRVTFVIATISYSSSPPLFLAPRFWEPRDQPQQGFFLEARKRTLGTTLRKTLVKALCNGYEIKLSLSKKVAFGALAF